MRSRGWVVAAAVAVCLAAGAAAVGGEVTRAAGRAAACGLCHGEAETGEPSPPGDAAAGKREATVCAACHGAQGVSSEAGTPNLAGQQQRYLFEELHDFKEGTRQDPVMTPIVKGLGEPQMRDLAAYYSGLPCRE